MEKIETVAYLRVSTDKQGERGLGMQAQKNAIIHYLGHVPDQFFIEVESGAKCNRPQLEQAVKLCKETGATLIIAKLDRLSRNLKFICELMESKVKFVAVDMPQANEFTIHIMAAMAQQERRFISERTKSALDAKRKAGYKFVKANNLSKEARAKSAQTRREQAKKYYGQIHDLIQSYASAGLTLTEISNKLNQLNYKTRSGKNFSPTTVNRVIKLFMNKICVLAN